MATNRESFKNVKFEIEYSSDEEPFFSVESETIDDKPEKLILPDIFKTRINIDRVIDENIDKKDISTIKKNKYNYKDRLYLNIEEDFTSTGNFRCSFSIEKPGNTECLTPMSMKSVLKRGSILYIDEDEVKRS